MSKLYTKTGDGGMTYLYDGSRRKKNSMFFDVIPLLSWQILLNALDYVD